MNGDDYSHRRKTPRLWVEIEESPSRWHLLTATSGNDETSIFLDGRQVAGKSGLLLTFPAGPAQGRLVVGNSVYNKHSWDGAISRLVLYDEILPAESIEHRNIQLQKTPDIWPAASVEPYLLYLFDEATGSIVRDQSDQQIHLEIPAKAVRLARKPFVSPT